MSKIRESARGEECTIRMINVCNGDPATVVWAHANGIRYGKGIAKKVPDPLGAYACYACHMVIDGQHPRPKGVEKQDVELDFWRGHGESLYKLVEKGLV